LSVKPDRERATAISFDLSSMFPDNRAEIPSPATVGIAAEPLQ